jgi:hypothetical protein
MAAAATVHACVCGSMSCRSSPTNSTSTSPSTICRRAPAKWNKIEHRLFSYISQNWRAQPLVSYRVIVDLISATTTKTGLTVRCEIDETLYQKGITVSDAEMAAINITRHDFHGEWNYTIAPNSD